MVPQKYTGYPEVDISTNDSTASPAAKRSRYNPERLSLWSSFTVMESETQFFDQSKPPIFRKPQRYPVDFFQNNVKKQPDSSVVEVEYPTPVWEQQELIAFALLNIPEATAKVHEIINFILNNFPFYKSRPIFLKTRSECLAKNSQLFKKVEGSSNRKGVSWTLVDRSRAIEEFKGLVSECGSKNALKVGMKNPALLDTFLAEKLVNNLDFNEKLVADMKKLAIEKDEETLATDRVTNEACQIKSATTHSTHPLASVFAEDDPFWSM